MKTTKQQKTGYYGMKDFNRDEKIFQKEIEPRMKKLLAMNDFNLREAGFGNKWREHINLQDTLIRELEEYGYKARSMTGRCIKFPHADSFALYMVVKVNKTTCRLQWIDYCDGWQDERLGESGSLPLEFVHSKICGQDKLRELFG